MSQGSFQQDEAAVTAPTNEQTTGSEVANTGASAEHEAPAQEPRTFTQEELDAIVAKEKAKAKRQAERELREAVQQPQRVVEPPNPVNFKTREEYEAALIDHKVEQKLSERDAQQQQQKVQSTFKDREETAREKYEDYDKVARANDLPITDIMGEAILESEIGPEVAYYLGMNREEANRIASLKSPLAQVREIGKIEAKLIEHPPAAPAKKTSSAPAPITPVGARSTVQKFDPTDPRSDKMSDSDWFAAERKRLENKARARA